MKYSEPTCTNVFLFYFLTVSETCCLAVVHGYQLSLYTLFVRGWDHCTKRHFSCVRETENEHPAVIVPVSMHVICGFDRSCRFMFVRGLHVSCLNRHRSGTFSTDVVAKFGVSASTYHRKGPTLQKMSKALGLHTRSTVRTVFGCDTYLCCATTFSACCNDRHIMSSYINKLNRHTSC